MKKQTPANLKCTYHTAGLILIALGAALVLTSCAGIYKFLGLDPDQIQDQTEKDQQAITTIIDTGREQLWQITTAAVTGIGTILSGLLATWLRTERKITTVLIEGIEAADNGKIKTTINGKAHNAGIEPKLNARVRALT